MTLTGQQLKFHIKSLITGSLILTASLLYCSVSFAKNLHSHQEIQAAAVEFVRSQLPDDIKIKQIKAGNIDPRIQFKQCSQVLETKSSMSRNIARNTTVAVRCNDDIPWSIYIPVKATLLRNMLVTKTTITRGELITADKVKLTELEIKNQNQKHFSDSSNVIGFEARRTIRANRVINSSMLKKALLVHKKETVLIFAQNNHIRVSMQGTALKNGHHNDMIKVRNNSSNKVIEALVIDRGIVSVNF